MSADINNNYKDYNGIKNAMQIDNMLNWNIVHKYNGCCYVERIRLSLIHKPIKF